MSTIRLNGFSMTYEDTGSGPAVLFLHGYPFHRTMWSEQIQPLGGSHRVIAPDLSGLGESDVSATTMEEMAQQVAALMTDLEISEAVIVALSMGGYVALAFYRLFPERVKGL